MALLTQASVEPYLDFLKYEKRFSAHTIISYQTDLTDWIDFTAQQFGKTDLRDVGHNHVRSWLAALKDRGLSVKSINRKISSLRSFFKYCLKTGVLDHTPMGKIVTPKAGRRLPVFVREEETTKLLQSLNASPEDWKGLNAKLLINIFYTTGMRLSELLNLREKQIDLGRGQIKVLGKGNKERIIPVGDTITRLIRDYQQEKKKKFEVPDDVLLVTEKGKKLYPRYAWVLVNTYLGYSSTLDRKSPHVLRHTFATHLMNNGANLDAVKDLLGHSSLAATQVYTHTTIGKLKDIHKKAHPRN